MERANARWKPLLRSYEAPPTAPAIREARDAFVAERKAEIIPAIQCRPSAVEFQKSTTNALS